MGKQPLPFSLEPPVRSGASPNKSKSAPAPLELIYLDLAAPLWQAPWYLNQDKPSLKHHQAWNAKSMGTRDWYIRGTKGDVKTKFIKGACENCGATTHTKKAGPFKGHLGPVGGCIGDCWSS